MQITAEAFLEVLLHYVMLAIKIASLTGSDAPSATNPITIYIKAGVYDEILPITVSSTCISCW